MAYRLSQNRKRHLGGREPDALRSYSKYLHHLELTFQIKQLINMKSNIFCTAKWMIFVCTHIHNLTINCILENNSNMT